MKKRNKKPNKRIKITIKSKEGRKKLDKKNFWLSLVTLLFVLISLQILFFATGRKDQKGIYDVQAGALCGQGTYQYNGCTACDMPPGWTYCGGGLTYECGTVCLHPSCGAAACSGPPCTPNCTGATCTFPACPTNYDVGNTECSTTTVSCNPGDGCGGTCPAINRTCWLVKRTATYDGNGGSCSVSRYDSCHGTASDTPSCSRAGHTLS